MKIWFSISRISIRLRQRLLCIQGTTPFFMAFRRSVFSIRHFCGKMFILNDPSKIGNYTDETFSPERIRTSTLSDEVKIVSGGLGRVYAVAPDAQQSIISAGHAANCAFWINDRNGKWATTTYYRDVPAYVEQFNYVRSLSARIDTLSWTPVYTPDRYTAIPYRRMIFLLNELFPETAVISSCSLRRRLWLIRRLPMLPWSSWIKDFWDAVVSSIC